VKERLLICNEEDTDGLACFSKLNTGRRKPNNCCICQVFVSFCRGLYGVILNNAIAWFHGLYDIVDVDLTGVCLAFHSFIHSFIDIRLR